ncbi:hypothetical protein R3W88_019432 [Solanum pinnatisectum]|uniref:Retrotransposon gag domain-containing protein n=1 Tax=Solanum pinnatisectum TaxID=50273 RepID=A0AAV9KM87_9SOLN|nr:hypothetical protein R3W88_019432 [Solanum pinnatisectum]
MTIDRHNLFIKFLKLNSPFFIGTEYKDAYDFLVDCHELLHKMDTVARFGVEFVTYQFRGDTKMWWQSHVECRPVKALLMIWATFSSFFMKKYIPSTLRDRRRDEFLKRPNLCFIRICDSTFLQSESVDHYFVKELRPDLQIQAYRWLFQ